MFFTVVWGGYSLVFFEQIGGSAVGTDWYDIKDLSSVCIKNHICFTLLREAYRLNDCHGQTLLLSFQADAVLFSEQEFDPLIDICKSDMLAWQQRVFGRYRFCSFFYFLVCHSDAVIGYRNNQIFTVFESFEDYHALSAAEFFETVFHAVFQYRLKCEFDYAAWFESVIDFKIIIEFFPYLIFSICIYFSA